MTTSLVLCGGGARALVPLQILKYIEAKTGSPAASQFDAVYGTSTGSLLALGLCRSPALSAVELEAAYLKWLPLIFGKPMKQNIGGLLGPRYKNTQLRAAIEAILGTGTYGPKAQAMATDLRTGVPVALSPAGGVTAVDCALASTAAPTYFTPHGIHADGGLGANDAALFALADRPKAKLLVLGCGYGPVHADIAELRTAGALGWLDVLLGAAMDGSQKALERLLPLLASGSLCINPSLADGSMDIVTPMRLAQLIADGQQTLADNKGTLDAWLEGLGT